MQPHQEIQPTEQFAPQYVYQQNPVPQQNFYEVIQPPAHFSPNERVHYINFCNKLCEVEEETSVLESECVYPSAQIA